MASEAVSPDANEMIEVDLKNQGLAALLAWLWPGAGHMYQGRYGKGVLFMVCILLTYFFGFTIGGGHVVYASWKKFDKRWQYGCQVWVGIPALPAAVQTFWTNRGHDALFNGFMAAPEDIDPSGDDQLASWHKRLGSRFELGTLYTVIAGLLNVLAIYDAFAGPFLAVPDAEEKKSKEQKRKKQKSSA